MSQLIAFDFETYLIDPKKVGGLAPNPVCVSFCDGQTAEMERMPAGLDLVEALLRPGVTVAGANIAYDWGVFLRQRPHMTAEVFAKYERGEIHDTSIAAALDAVADGRMTDRGILDRNGAPMRSNGADGKIAFRFSLENTVWLYTGRTNAKANAEYRLKYGELDALPTEEWPEEARQYPLDDARNTYEVAKIQREHAKNLGEISGKDWTHLTHQCRTAFAMHLGLMWGLEVDLTAAQMLKDDADRIFAESRVRFRELGLVKEDGKDNAVAIKRRIILAYGGSAENMCPVCKGTGKVKSEKTGKDINCKPCGATALEVPPTVPRTPAEGIGADRDACEESADPVLEQWAQVGKVDKMRETYGPWLLSSKLLNISRANVLLASARASYDGLVQLIPAKAREPIIARKGRVLCSVDFAALELCTLAQSTYITVGESKMRDVINESKDPGALHTAFAAQMAGVYGQPELYEAFKLQAKDKSSKAAGYRQMAKAANFGFPGLMGPAKFVLAKRREGLRLCVVSGRNQKCERSVFEWKGKSLSRPTCPACIEIAEKLRKDWYKAWPEIPKYFNWVKTLPGLNEDAGVIVSPGSGYIRGGLSAANAANHPFQHLAAMGAKQALWEVQKEAYTDPKSPLYGTTAVFFVHDELLAEMPERQAHEAAFRLAEVMISAMRKFTPDVHISAEPCLMRRWYKKAEAVYENGRLIPWEPN